MPTIPRFISIQVSGYHPHMLQIYPAEKFHGLDKQMLSLWLLVIYHLWFSGLNIGIQFLCLCQILTQNLEWLIRMARETWLSWPDSNFTIIFVYLQCMNSEPQNQMNLCTNIMSKSKNGVILHKALSACVCHICILEGVE